LHNGVDVRVVTVWRTLTHLCGSHNRYYDNGHNLNERGPEDALVGRASATWPRLGGLAINVHEAHWSWAMCLRVLNWALCFGPEEICVTITPRIPSTEI
jgi:hypothetical protein